MTPFALQPIFKGLVNANTQAMRKIINSPLKITWGDITLCLLMLVTAPITQAAKSTHPRVATHQVEQGTIIDEIRLSGTVSSPRVASLSTEVSGLVKKITVDAGSQVQSGDLLMTLDTEFETLTLQATQATARRAEEELSDAKRRFEDGKRLAKKKTFSASELKSLEAEVNIARANLQRYAAEKRLQIIKLDRHQLVAPFAGVISKKFIEVGEWIRPGDAVVELVAEDNLRIDFQVPQRALPRIKNSSEIRIKLDALPNTLLHGVIQAIVPYSDTDARTFLLRVSLAESNPSIAAGMSANGLLRLKTDSQGIVIPRDAILRYPDGRITVWVVNNKQGNRIVSERRVTPGSSFNGQVSILDGLKVGEQVVTEGNEALKDGQTVILNNP